MSSPLGVRSVWPGRGNQELRIYCWGSLRYPRQTKRSMRRLRMARTSSGSIDLNKLDYTEFVLSIDVRSSSGKVAFGMVKGYQSKDYIDGKAAIAWYMKKKFKPNSAPSLVKTEKMFRQSVLKRNKDPDNWIIYLEKLGMKLEDMGFTMIDEHPHSCFKQPYK